MAITPRPRWRTWLAGILAAVLTITALAYGITATMRVPPPHQWANFFTTQPSEQGQVFPARPVENLGEARPFEVDGNGESGGSSESDGGSPGIADGPGEGGGPGEVDGSSEGDKIPGTVPWKGSDIPLDEMLDVTNSRAFLVVHDGKIVYEWYSEGVDGESGLSSWSVAKSVVSLMIGQAIGRGDLSEDDLLVDVLPELRTRAEGPAGSAASPTPYDEVTYDVATYDVATYDEVTVRDLLDMASGIDVSENYNPWWPVNGTARLLLSTDLPGYLSLPENQQLAFEPGSQGEYRSVDTQLLAMIVAKVNDRPLSEVASTDLWTPLGAESGATWNLDREGGTEKGFCCLNATARDFAKIGQMVLDNGRVGDTQVVPAEWIERISTPSGLKLGDWNYSAQWWHSPNSDGDFTAIGVYGQYIYVDPDARTVIVKLSDHGTEQDEVETVDAMRFIAERLAGRES
ncbi:MAG: serine hydrolase [Ancrocorticia sp.]